MSFKLLGYILSLSHFSFQPLDSLIQLFSRRVLNLSDLKFLPAQGEQHAALALALYRSGTRSAYGDLVINFYPDNSDKALLVGRMNGLAVYTPNDLRYVKVTLKPENPVIFAKGKLVAQFFSQMSEDSKLLAEASLYLP